MFNLGSGHNYRFFDSSIIAQYSSVGIVTIVACAMLVVCCIIIVMRIMNIRGMVKGKAIQKALDDAAEIRRRDESIIKSNKRIKKITDRIKSTPFRMSEGSIDYVEYNLKRAGIDAPGTGRYMRAEEFHAITKLGEFIGIALGLLVAIVFNIMGGIIVAVMSIIACGILPMMIIRRIVADKDGEVVENFADIYLMIHYTMMQGGKTPLEIILDNYSRTASSKEMLRFVNVCKDHIDTYGEMLATSYIAKDYREIGYVNKLMRLVRQMHEGAEIRKELTGFRDEIISAQKYELRKKAEKNVRLAQISLGTLYIILIQAIISAMAIYLPDLGIFTSIL